MKPVLLVLFLLAEAPGFGQGVPLPDVQQQQFGATGLANSAGFVCTYAAGTTTPLATYSDVTLVTNAHNPIQLNAAGRPVAWQTSTEIEVFAQARSYKIVVHAAGTGSTCNGTAVGAAISTRDNVNPANIYTVSFNNRQFCTTGATYGAKFSAAAALLPSTGGIVDCSNLQGAQIVSGSDPFTGVTKPITLIWPIGTVSSSISVTVPSNMAIQFSQGAILSMAVSTIATMNGDISDSTLSQHFAGAGSVRLNSASSPLIYPQWFGAVFDGSTDDSSAWQGALNAASTQGSTIMVSAGTSVINAQLTGCSALPCTTSKIVNFLGVGRGTPNSVVSGSEMKFTLATGTAMFLMYGSTGISLQLHVSHLAVLGVASSGVAFDLGNDIAVADFQTDTVFDDVSIQDFGSWAIRTTTLAPRLAVHNSDFRNNSGHISFSEQGELVLHDNYFSSVRAAADDQIFASKTDKARIFANVFLTNTDSHGIHLKNSRNPSIRDNSFEQTTVANPAKHYIYHEYTAIESLGCVIEGNKMTRSSQSSAAGGGRLIRLEHPRGCVITGNSLTVAAAIVSSPILLSDFIDVNIGRNYWEDASNPLLAVSGTNTGLTFDGVAERVTLQFSKVDIAAGFAGNAEVPGTTGVQIIRLMAGTSGNGRVYVIGIYSNTDVNIGAGESLIIKARLPGGATSTLSMTMAAGTSSQYTRQIPTNADSGAGTGTDGWGVNLTASNNGSWVATTDVQVTLELLVFESYTNAKLVN